MQIFQNIATVVGCLTTCLTLLVAIVKPIRQWLVDSISRKSNQTKISQKIDELDKKIDVLINKNEGLEIRLTRVETNVLENEADRIRAELFDCGNRCRRGIRLHPEEFEHIKEIYRKYTDVLHQNHEGETEYNFIYDYYNHQSFSEYHEHN